MGLLPNWVYEPLASWRDAQSVRPYRFEVTDYIRPGTNELVLEVTGCSASLLGHNDAFALLNAAEITARAEPVPSGLLAPLRLRW